jgi:hypothetical protein
MSINRAIVNATRTLIESIAAEYPETDTRLLVRRVQELVQNTITAETSQGIMITASDVAPKVNHAADMLALAHCMYVSGDKANAGKMTAVAFNHPDCYALMETLSELNEEVDPLSSDEMNVQVNKIEPDIADVTGDPNVGESPAIHVNPLLNNPENWLGQDSKSVEAKDAMAILAELELQPQHLSDDGLDSMPSDSSDEFQSSLQDSNDDLDPNKWDMDADEPELEEGGGLLSDFENDEDSDVGTTPGISETAEGHAQTTKHPDEDSDMAMDSNVNPMQAIIASIKDPRAIAVINAVASKGDPKSKAQLNAFINLYCQRNKIKI